ncbi:hypothetical protein [Lewinella sp. 4G2]|uniref:hypothetical protein n=1 Tax=Lewinella sp. 4G2 TaxID=1803372 RepID=UPI0007B4C67E|nr:hypothetical protein [Lewinella sp. 4G2]OAV44201.1 hypothetical protein A3850_006705 [Lewinella sp. 4G2]
MAALIPKKYTLALFFSAIVGTFLIGSWHVRSLERQLETVTSQTEATHAATIELLELQLVQLHRATDRQLLDDSKALWRPMLTIFQRAKEVRQTFDEAVAGDYDMGIRCAFGPRFTREEVYHWAADREMEGFVTDLTNHLRDYGKDYDLHPDDIEFRISRYNKELQQFQDWDWDELEELPRDLAVDLVTIDLLTLQFNLLEDLASMHAGRTIICDAFFPVVSANACSYARGDTLRAKVAVGSYSTNLNPNNVDLRVNGQRLHFNEDGTADYISIVRQPGQQTLNTSVKVTNPLTGIVQAGEGQFTYEVR